MHNLTAIQIQEQVAEGKFSAEEVTRYFLQRIQSLDNQIGAFLSVSKERAIEMAQAVDRKRAASKPLGKLAGVPIALKDNIHLKGEISTCGSKFLTNYKAPFNSTVAELLAEEDAVFIGKTNLDEFAMGSSTENSALKRTCNPWDLKCSPGGSSGGSAAAVAARMVPLALGSDTGGSIRQPASFCGLVGFKPTYGRVSRSGLVAYGSSLDQIGPLTKDVKDSALIMSIIGKHCKKDSTSIHLPQENYLQNLRSDLKGIRIGVPYLFLEGLADAPKKSFNLALEQLKALGAVLVDVDLNILKYSIATYYILATAEASTNLARFDGIRYGLRAPEAKTLDEVYELSKEEGFGAEVKRRIMLGTFVLSAGYQDAYYKKAQKVRRLIIESYNRAFENCDIIATPTSPFDAFEIGSIKDPIQMYLEDIYTIAINLAGLPAISVPNGLSPNGKPLGLQLIGPQMKDGAVLSIAHAFETISRGYELIPSIVTKGA